MSNHGHRGVLFFRIQISPLCSECPIPPPQVNSCHMPCASLHAAAPSQYLIISIIVIILIIIIIIIIRLEIRIFRHPFSNYLTLRWKLQVRASIGIAKRDIGVCGNADRVFFPRTMHVYLTMYTSKWLFKWTKWWATMDIVGCSLFGSRYLRSALNVQFHPPKWTLVTCLVRLFTQQPLRSILSSASSSLLSSSLFDLRFGFFDIHLPRHLNFCKQMGEAKERRRFSMLRLDRNFPFVLSKRWFASAWRPYWQV